MTALRTSEGIALMIAATFVFSIQDALSRHLAGTYNVWMVVMIRYWVFAAAVLLLAARQPGGISAVAATRQPGLQILRGLLLAAEICAAVIAFTAIGLVAYHALFASAPLIVAALSFAILGERVGWRRWTAIAVATLGVLIILQPGREALSPGALLALLSAFLFALYGLLTRRVARHDSAEKSFFWTGVVGAVSVSAIGLWFWEPMDAAGWGWMATLSAAALLGHWLLIRCYAVAEASAVQPFAFFHLLFASAFGVLLFGDALELHVVTGAAIVVGAALYAIWRERANA